MGKWHGDEWRWTRWSQPASGPRYIDVIEPPRDSEERSRRGRKVPFGFSRVLVDLEPVEPLRWEGDDA